MVVKKEGILIPYVVYASVTGEPSTIQQRGGKTYFYNRAEAEQFQRDLRTSGFDRVDISEVGDPTGYYEGQVMAPPVTPDLPFDIPRGTVEFHPTTGAAIPVTGYSQNEIEKMRQLETAIAAKPQLAQARESLREQLVGQERGFFGVKNYPRESEKEFIRPIAEELRFDVQRSLRSKQEQLSIFGKQRDLEIEEFKLDVQRSLRSKQEQLSIFGKQQQAAIQPNITTKPKSSTNIFISAYEKGKGYISKANKFISSEPFFIGMAVQAKKAGEFWGKAETKYKQSGIFKELNKYQLPLTQYTPATASATMFNLPKYTAGARYEMAEKPVSYGAEMGIGYGMAKVLGGGIKIMETGGGKNPIWRYFSKPTITWGLGGAYAYSTTKELAQSKSPFELGQKSVKPASQIMGFSLVGKIKVSAKDRPYFYTTRTPTYVKTESGQPVLSGYITKVNYNRLMQPMEFKVTKMEEFSKITKIQSGARVIKSGENIFVVRETTKRYVMPRKAKEVIPIAFKGEEMTFIGKVKIGSKEYPQFVKTEIKQGYGYVYNPFSKTKVKGDRLFSMIEVNQKNIIKEVRVGNKGQKLEPYIFKQNGIKKYIDYDKYKFEKVLGGNKKKQLFYTPELILTSQVKGKPIAVPKELKAKFEAEVNIRKPKAREFKEDILEKDLFEPETVKKQRVQKAVLKITQVKTTKNIFVGGGVITTTKAKTKYDYGIGYQPTQESYSVSAPSLKFGKMQYPSIKAEPISRNEQLINPNIKMSPIGKQEPFPELGIYPEQKIGPKQDIIPKLRVEQIPKQKLRGIVPDWSTTREPPPDKITPFIPPFRLPKQYSAKKRKGTKRFNPFNPKYNPSLVATFFKIKGKKPKIISGIEIRPILR